jgi:flagellar hook-basal body complex protein FliE
MSLEAIGAIAAVGAPVEIDGLIAPSTVQGPAAGFGDWFTEQVGQVNTSVATMETGIQKLVAGESQSLHDVMISMEEAKLSFQLLAQVRNRLLDAYQEVMRMQV